MNETAATIVLVLLSSLALIGNIISTALRCRRGSTNSREANLTAGAYGTGLIALCCSVLLLLLHREVQSSVLCSLGGGVALAASMGTLGSLVVYSAVLHWRLGRRDRPSCFCVVAVVLVALWSVSVALGVLPLVPSSYFKDGNAVNLLTCFPLRPQNERGWAYSVLLILLAWVAEVIVAAFLVRVAGVVVLKKGIACDKRLLARVQRSGSPTRERRELAQMGVQWLLWLIVLLATTVEYAATSRTSGVQWALGYILVLLLLIFSVMDLALVQRHEVLGVIKRGANDATLTPSGVFGSMPEVLEECEPIATPKGSRVSLFTVGWLGQVESGQGHSPATSHGLLKVYRADDVGWRREVKVAKLAQGSDGEEGVARVYWASRRNAFHKMLSLISGRLVGPRCALVCREYFAHGTLRHYVSTNIDVITEALLHAAILDVARALTFLHSHGIAHRNLTAGKVFVTRPQNGKTSLRIAIGDFEDSVTKNSLLDDAGSIKCPEIEWEMACSSDTRALSLLSLELIASITKFRVEEDEKRRIADSQKKGKSGTSVKTKKEASRSKPPALPPIHEQSASDTDPELSNLVTKLSPRATLRSSHETLLSQHSSQVSSTQASTHDTNCSHVDDKLSDEHRSRRRQRENLEFTDIRKVATRKRASSDDRLDRLDDRSEAGSSAVASAASCPLGMTLPHGGDNSSVQVLDDYICHGTPNGTARRKPNSKAEPVRLSGSFDDRVRSWLQDAVTKAHLGSPTHSDKHSLANSFNGSVDSGAPKTPMGHDDHDSLPPNGSISSVHTRPSMDSGLCLECGSHRLGRSSRGVTPSPVREAERQMELKRARKTKYLAQPTDSDSDLDREVAQYLSNLISESSESDDPAHSIPLKILKAKVAKIKNLESKQLPKSLPDKTFHSYKPDSAQYQPLTVVIPRTGAAGDSGCCSRCEARSRNSLYVDQDTAEQTYTGRRRLQGIFNKTFSTDEVFYRSGGGTRHDHGSSSTTRGADHARTRSNSPVRHTDVTIEIVDDPRVSKPAQAKSSDRKLEDNQRTYCESLGKNFRFLDAGALLTENQGALSTQLAKVKAVGHLGYIGKQHIHLIEECWGQESHLSAQQMLEKMRAALPSTSL